MSIPVQSPLERVSFAKGTKIFREGEPGACAYLIENGKIEISASNHGQKIIISTLGGGEMFGEMALIDNQKRSATATVVEDADIIPLDRAQFENRISMADPVLHMLLRVVLKRFRWALRKALSKERMQMTGEIPNVSEEVLFDSARDQAIRQIRLERDLREALDARQFEMHYQPIVASDNMRIAGFEALIRWRHPERGMLPPAEFISAAEDSNLIVPIGAWVLEQSLADLAHLQAAQAAGRERLFMTVNVSSRQIQDVARKDNLAAAMRNAGVRPADIKLEFTESVLIESPEMAAQALGEIKRMGVDFAIDDFGTGYSSLSYLQRFPLDVLKIDRSFISDMCRDEGSLRIVRAIVGLSKSLSMDVVAEGIETVQALTISKELGCDFLQGYLLARPAALEDVMPLVAADIDFGSLTDDSQTPVAVSAATA